MKESCSFYFLKGGAFSSWDAAVWEEEQNGGIEIQNIEILNKYLSTRFYFIILLDFCFKHVTAERADWVLVDDSRSGCLPTFAESANRKVQRGTYLAEWFWCCLLNQLLPKVSTVAVWSGFFMLNHKRSGWRLILLIYLFSSLYRTVRVKK